MNNTIDIRYVLERYRSGGANRYVCPQCGRKKCFTRYVDLESGGYVADECGKCNHVVSCGYHYPPREFFHDHPWLNSREVNEVEFIQGKPLLGLSRRRTLMVQEHRQVLQERHQTVFFDMAWAEKSMRRTSTFRCWLEQLSQDGVQPGLFDGENLRRVLADYYVGGTQKDVVKDGVNYGPAVVFWLIDEQGRVHDAKLMAYRCDGHRVGDWVNTMRSICERKHIGPQLAETEKVLFGLHLLPRYPDKSVCIVESEKTAIVCACRYPQNLWLATGGCGNFQSEKLQPLQNRRVVVYPDSGEYEKWKECMERSGHTNYHVVDFMEQYEPNTDIADILLDEARQKPEILLPPSTELCPF